MKVILNQDVKGQGKKVSSLKSQTDTQETFFSRAVLQKKLPKKIYLL